jgi:hypothetical protein
MVAVAVMAQVVVAGINPGFKNLNLIKRGGHFAPFLFFCSPIHPKIWHLPEFIRVA